MSFGDGVEYGERQAVRIGDVVSRLLRSKRFYQGRKYGALADAWTATVGEKMAEHTTIASFEHGRLVVGVDTPILLHELSGFMCGAILAELQQAAGGQEVAELRFCLGEHDARRKTLRPR